MIDPEQYKQTMITQVRELAVFTPTEDMPRVAGLINAMTRAAHDSDLLRCVGEALSVYTEAIAQGRPHVDPVTVLRVLLDQCMP